MDEGDVKAKPEEKNLDGGDEKMVPDDVKAKPEENLDGGDEKMVPEDTSDKVAGRSAEGADDLSLSLIDDDMGVGSATTDPVQAQAKPKPKSRAAAKKKGGKGDVHCFGCGQWRKAEYFSLSQTVCSECKKYLDRIYGFCQRQGELEWWSSNRRDPKKTKRMLDHYRDLVGKAGSSSSAPKFVVAEAREVIRTENRTECNDRGRLMWEQQVWILAT